MNGSTGMRQRAERLILAKTVDVLLAAGCEVSVNDSEETTVRKSRDKAAILAACMTTDEDFLIVAAGWVRFVYGNDGYDVISDYTTNLETLLTPVHALADAIERGDA